MFTLLSTIMSKVYRIILPLIFLMIQTGFSQDIKTGFGTLIEIKVRVVDQETGKSIKNAYVYANGETFPYSYINQYYLVRLKLNDELVIWHPGFKTLFFRVESDEDIRVELTETKENREYQQDVYSRNRSKVMSSSDDYFTNLDSANFYKKINIEKSLSFIENILRENYSDGRNAATYRLLGDIYYEWMQYDLAISYYKNSLQYREDERTKYQLIKAAMAIKEFDIAETYLLTIKTSKLGLFEKILVYENLGDIYLEKKEFAKAITNYNRALKISEDNKVTSKITDINSKLGDVSVAQGNIPKANRQFRNSIKLASEESPVRSLEEKDKVADFYNSTQQFDKEINLRKQALLETKQLNDSVLLIADKESNSKVSANDSIGILNGFLDVGNLFDTYQISAINSASVNNYKIGRALVEKEDYEEAIPFLKKSIEDADKNKDLIVKKDATRKLSEVYENVGEYDKAYKTYREYVSLVDTLYARKEQEIEYSKRTAKKSAEYRNRIASLEKDKALSDSRYDLAFKNKQLSVERTKLQQYVIYSLIAGILAMIVFTYLLFRSNKQQKLSNNLLALKSMRSQMNPHFIFNALNSVNSFIAVNDERNANRYLSEFSVLMRSVLENSDEDFIPFAKEVELIELYVKLEHNRFKEKFDYKISIDEAIDLDQYSIPPMLLQPYIENAIWHGLRYKEEKGNLHIEVQKVDEESISVLIKDDGVGRKRSQELKTKNQLKQKSKGMSTIKKRITILNDMYQDKISVSVSDLFENGTGTQVKLLLKRN
ncbi:histidine kinase [Pseudotenacibaculum haliotis]|uniref:Histidine kinase n=1 Tax=Pseudotenacibaculum haliotis TaxID=1862138 RepID=A0ABW5LPM6_9FLAO